MPLLWKIVLVSAALLVLPLGAYAVGSLAAVPEAPAPRRVIEITDPPRPATSVSPRPSEPATSGPARPETEPDRRQQDRDDVRVVTPRPAPVDDDDDDRNDDRDDDQGDDDDD